MRRQTRLIDRSENMLESLPADTFPALVGSFESVAELVINQMNPQVCWISIRAKLNRLSHCDRHSDIRQLLAIKRRTEQI